MQVDRALSVAMLAAHGRGLIARHGMLMPNAGKVWHDIEAPGRVRTVLLGVTSDWGKRRKP